MSVPSTRRSVGLLAHSFALGYIVACAASARAQSKIEPALLDWVRDAHVAAREAVRTLSCRVDFKGIMTTSKKPPTTQTCSGHYWCSPDAIRSKVSEFGEQHDWLWKDSVRQSIVRRVSSGKHVVGASRGAFGNRHLGRCDPYVRGLLVLNLPDTVDHVHFEEWLRRASNDAKAERTTVDGRDIVVVRARFEPKKSAGMTWNCEVHLEPTVNYLIRKIVLHGRGANGEVLDEEEEVTQFKECSRGIFFPTHTIGLTTDKGGDWKYAETTVIDELRVNERLPDSIFDFQYPRGIYLNDSIRQVGYYVDELGRPISPERPLARGPPPPPAAAPATRSHATESNEEAGEPTRFILPVSIGIIVLAGILLFVRRWRRPKGPPWEG